MSKNLVAIWMVTYNHEPFITKAIESVLMQKTNFNFHLYIGEDCSRDKTYNICKNYAEKYPNIITLHAQKKNIGAIKNGKIIYKACLESGAKYVAMLEGDDYWTDKFKLQKQVDFLKANPTYAGVFHNVVFKYQDKNIEHLFIDKETESKSFNFKEIVYLNPIHTSSFIFRNNLLKLQIDQFKIVGDRPLFTLISNLGPIQYLNFVGSCYRINQNSTWTPLSLNKQVLLVVESYKGIMRFLKSENKRVVKTKISGYYFNLSIEKNNGLKNRLKYVLLAFKWSFNFNYLFYALKILVSTFTSNLVFRNKNNRNL